MVAGLESNPVITTYPLPFEDTGILNEEEGSPVLLADTGGRYWLEYTGSLPVGTWVHVSGVVDHACASVSHQIAGRIRRNSIEPVSAEFRGEGELVEGRESVLLHTSGGKRYVVNDCAGFQPGQRVRVAGTLVPLRVTLYDEGDGCILNDSIERYAG